jgi:arylsulfatase A-like enzyme
VAANHQSGYDPRMRLDGGVKRVFLVALTLAVCAARPCVAQDLPNIVLILPDDHGWEDLGFMGHPVVRTAHIDKLASESLVFTRGYVPTALCRPSLATLVTGLYPHQHGITGNDPPEKSGTAGRSEMVAVFKRNTTLLSLLHDKGYVSFQSGKWWEGNPLDHGFTAAMTHGDPTRGGRHGDEGLNIGREGMQPIYDFIQSAGKKPFFVWYAPFLPHTPHRPPARLLEKYQRPDRPLPVARYYAMIEWLDETVGELLGYLDRQGLRHNTLVIYVADNGWIQSETGIAADQVKTRGKLTPYEAGIRTPIALRWPARVKPNRNDQTLAGSIDVAPTTLRAAGTEPPAAMVGVNLLDSTALARRKTLFGSLSAHTSVDVRNPVANLKYRTVVREDGWKLILPYEPNRSTRLTIDGRTADWMSLGPELYNVRDDPHEMKNLIGERPKIVEELRALIDKWWPVPQ